MKTDNPASYYIDRLSAFDDSIEFAEYYNEAVQYAADNGEYDYWSAETRDHILGLWLFAKECVEKIREMEGENDIQNGA
jgi:hypothetical protein